jgi:hypothetical protein
MEKMDIAEFNIMLTTSPSWLQAYARDQAKKLEIEDSDGKLDDCETGRESKSA